MMKKLPYLAVLLVLLVSACIPAAQAQPNTTAAQPNSSTVNSSLPTVNSGAAPTPAVAIIPVTANVSPQTYTVLVGLDDQASGAAIDAYFPATIHIHVGDTVVWKKNSNEIHTVTFLGMLPDGSTAKAPDLLVPMPNAPQGAMMINPVAGFPAVSKDGTYNGTAYANSGIIGPDQGQATQFSLTFTKAGSYKYTCVVHGVEDMTGTVVVDDASMSVPTQVEDDAQAKTEMNAAMAKIPDIAKAATAEIPADAKNADGSTNHFVLVGYTDGQIDLDFFFPQTLQVNTGDTVTWVFSKQDVAPHTITFLNGATAPSPVKAIPQPNGPPLLTFDPFVAMPQNADKPLTNMGVYNSGILDPIAPGPHQFMLKIGNYVGSLQYQCILHDDLGMTGTLTVAQK
jgi:plastocyanin